MNEEIINQQDEKDLNNNESFWGRVRGKNFHISTVCYLILIIVAFFGIIYKAPFLKKISMTGLVIGSLFTFIALLYFYRHHLRGEGTEFESIISWLLPALLLQIIIIFAFIITLSGVSKFYKGSMYTDYYRYGKIFIAFQESEDKILKTLQEPGKDKKNLFDEIELFYTFYSGYFAGLEKPISKNDKKEEESHPKKEKDVVKGDLKKDKETKGTDLNKKELIQNKYAELSKRINRIPVFIGLTFGFLGALIFCLSDVIKRFKNVDLYPRTFVFYTVRIIVSASLAVALAFFVTKDWPTVLLAMIFFFIGYFPDRAIRFIDDKITEYIGIKKDEKYEPIALSKIQGLTNEKALRLREIGIEDVQHLAVANINYMERNLPFGKALICDWIAQSILVLHFPDHVLLLRPKGIRTILDLKRCALDKKEDDLKESAQCIGMDLAYLKIAKEILSGKDIDKKILELQDCM